MNIWILNHYAVTPDLPGGTRHFDFAEELTKRGHKVTIFCSSFHFGLRKETRFSPREKRIFKKEKHNGVRFVWVKTFPYKKNDWRRVMNMLSYSYRVFKIGKFINIEKPDVIIGSSVHLFAVFTAYLLSRYYKSHFIMEIRDLWPETLIDIGVPRWHPLVILLRIMEIFLYKKAEKILVLLPKADKYLEFLGVSNDRIVWIPNGVNLIKYEKAKIERYEKEENGFVVMYTGVMGKANNIETILEAFKKLKNYKDIKLILIGDGPEKEELKKISVKNGLYNVHFLNAVPKQEVPSYLQMADVLIFNLINAPVFKFGISSNKLFDYLASGKPIIFASNAINNPVKEADAGLTVLPNSEAIAEAIIRLYNLKEEERINMGRKGLEYVKKYHHIPILVDKLEEALKDVTSYKNFAPHLKTGINHKLPSINVISMNKIHAKEVAKLHKLNIPGFLSTLGIPFLTLLYRKMAEDPTSFVLVANSKDGIEGFVSASINVKKFYKSFLASSFSQVTVTLILQFMNLSVWRKIFETLRYPLKDNDLPHAELLSMAVIEEARGREVAIRLFEALKKEMREKKVKKFKVTVGSDNVRANKFYEKVGFKFLTQIEVHAGEKSNVWVHSLDGGG